MTAKRPIKCAIYTRKSSEEGLEQEFNSLQAQREACEAYVASQKSEGWVFLKERYDDGGYSGGTLERPALQTLMRETEAGRVDVVVVYKIDRLSRSLMDFAKLVEVFEKRNVTFVSVTQAFSTTTSMGRLTLNVLLSFAQFERELTGERIRDKFAASKKKGIWMGGCPPLGYDILERKLLVNSAEAETVKLIFRRYLDLGCVRALRDDLQAKGVVSKVWTSAGGKLHGGRPFDRGALYCLLKNRVYVGETVHKGVAYPGEHQAIVPRELFDSVQGRLMASRRRGRPSTATVCKALLVGLIFDDQGRPMTPTYSRKPDGREYRYYVSSPLITGERQPCGSIPRVPAQPIEDVVVGCLRKLDLATPNDENTSKAAESQSHVKTSTSIASAERIHTLLKRIELRSTVVEIHLDRGATLSAWRSTTNELDDPSDGDLIARHRPQLGPGETLDVQGEPVVVTLPMRAKFRGGRAHIQTAEGRAVALTSRIDQALVKAICRAHVWLQLLLSGRIDSIEDLAEHVEQDRGYVARVLRLAFLSPQIIASILDGSQPTGLSLTRFLEAQIPLSWSAQAETYLF